MLHFQLSVYGQVGGSPLSSCSMDESCRDILKGAGADGWTPLLQAAEHADLAAIKELLLHKADVEARTKVSPLSCSHAGSLYSSSSAQ